MSITNKQGQSSTDTSGQATRISEAFDRAQHEKRGVLIPYFMCGYPSAEQSVALALAAAEAGADIIELGMPFSDPLADGATIQHAGHLALERGMTIRGCMEVARTIATRSNVPLIFMGYYNPLLAYGIESFCQDAAACGICGLIIPDLPPEEAEPLQQATQRAGLALIFLIPPTTPDERIAHISRLAAGIPGSFIYCVSLSGVTGARSELPAHLPAFLTRVHSYTKEYGLPLAVGFGLSKPEHISTVVKLVNGAVVASVLVKLLDEHMENEQVEVVRRYIGELRQAAGR
ncbi:MAG TPA: tryptophan synthase subunit alpha [Ktedonobacteraceae bacterium]|nr:tryptophan synthase subunit alpha [Ktedonobacteraceae bacterium]